MLETVVAIWGLLWFVKFFLGQYLYEKKENAIYFIWERPFKYFERQYKSALFPWIKIEEGLSRKIIVLIRLHNAIGILILVLFISAIILFEKAKS